MRGRMLEHNSTHAEEHLMRTSTSGTCAADRPLQAVHEKANVAAPCPENGGRRKATEGDSRAKTPLADLRVVANIYGWEVAVIQRRAAADVGQLRRAPDTPEVDVRVVSLAVGCVPVVP